MSYSIYLFHADVKAQADGGRGLDEIEYIALAPEAASAVLERLHQLGYVLESEGERSRDYVKNVGQCPVQVAVFSSEIAFSVPYWEGSARAIAQALQDAGGLAGSTGTVVFDPQVKKWGN